MLRSHTVWLVPVALTLVGFWSSAAAAIAQTTYSFSGDYDVVNKYDIVTSQDSQPFYAQAHPNWVSSDASYGLTRLSGIVYAQINFATGVFNFTTAPETFGLKDFPSGPLVLEGSGSDKLFVTDIASGVLDSSTNRVTTSGTLTITGGEGSFRGATGKLAFTEIGTLSPDPSVPFRAQSSINGSFEVPAQAVPEPRTDAALVVGMGIIGAGVLLRRRSRRATSG